jgi:glycosyltransferase involved in cell wall biosynthesis
LQSLKTRSISIIIPITNEEKRVESCIRRILSFCKEKEWDFEIIFAEDGSTDKSASIVNRYILSDHRIKMVNTPTRQGKGGAIISTALNIPVKDCIAYMDVDLAADPCELEKLIGYLEHSDIVLGSRLLSDDSVKIRRPFYRSVLSHVYSRLFRTLFRNSIHDPQCGLKVFRRDIVPKLLENVTVKGFAFDTQLIVTAYSQGLRVKEVPVNWTHGKFSKISLHHIKSMGLDLFSIWYNFHLLWKQSKACYPQKRGSAYGRILFSLLSLSDEIKERNSIYSKINKPTATDLSQSKLLSIDSNT